MLYRPFVPSAAKPPPNPTPPPAKKAQATSWLSAPHFVLDKLSEHPPENSGRCWDELSRYGCIFFTFPFQPGKNIENLEKFLYFGGKRNSCRGPPDFR